MDDLVREAEELKKKTQRTRYQFLLIELEVCFTALDFGATEYKLGDEEVAVQELSAVSKGIETLERFTSQMEYGEERREIEGKVEELRKATSAFERMLKGAESGSLPA